MAIRQAKVDRMKVKEMVEGWNGKKLPKNMNLKALIELVTDEAILTREEKEREELREQHQQHLDRMDEEQRKAEEFKARSVLIPIGKRGVILNVCFDNSDPMTDYFDRHHSIESRLLAIIPEGREDEKSLRNVIDRIPALKEIPFKWHTEKYSMGHGNYLESETCPEERPHPYDKDRQVRCHYEITFQKGYRGENRAIPHPDFYLGEITGGGGNERGAIRMPGNGNGRETVLEMTIRENPQMNGVEILFPSKPSREVIDTLKGHGFRWSFKQGLWWKRNSPGLIENIEKALKGSSAAQLSSTWACR